MLRWDELKRCLFVGLLAVAAGAACTAAWPGGPRFEEYAAFLVGSQWSHTDLRQYEAVLATGRFGGSADDGRAASGLLAPGSAAGPAD